jgi:Predicted ATP-dependent endonuclease of the OLD family
MKIKFLYGPNGTGKTKVLELLNRYFISKNKKTLFFPAYRTFNLTKEEVISSLFILKSMNIEIVKNINIHNMIIPSFGSYINNGFEQIINIFPNILKHDKIDVLLIDSPEVNLSTYFQSIFIDCIEKMNIVEKIIVVAHSNSINKNLNYMLDIKFCVNL